MKVPDRGRKTSFPVDIAGIITDSDKASRFDRRGESIMIGQHPFLAASLMSAISVAPMLADEGMWLVNDPPRELLRKKYGFEIGAAWLERVQKASVRFNNGGSGGFVSPDGLVLTNHHIGADCLQKLSPKDKDYYH